MTHPVGAALREVAGTELYRRNPFRITGLSTYADRRAIRQRRQRVIPALEAGADIDLGHDLPVGAEEVRAAFDRLLGDPRRRLADELFWLWDTPDAGCECARDLHVDHDAAVLAHSAALDMEAETDPAPDELDELWSEAARRWKAVLRRAALWDHVRGRIESLDDRQLDESIVDVFRAALPATLLRPLTDLVARPGPRQAEQAGRARVWPAPELLINDQLEDAAAPLYEAVSTVLSEAGRQLDADEPRPAAAMVREKVLPKLRQLEPLVPSDRHRRTASARNDAAILLNNCATRLVDAAGPAAEREAREWYAAARELTSDPHTVRLIDENSDALDEFVEMLATIEQRVEKLKAAGRPDLAHSLLTGIKQRMGDAPGAEEIDRLRKDVYVRPYQYGRRRSSSRLRSVIMWLAVLIAGGFLVSQCFGGSPDTTTSSGTTPVALFSKGRVNLDAAGQCIATKAGWEGDKAKVPVVDCAEPHWGEVLGTVPLAEEPSAYPGDDQVHAMATFECRRLMTKYLHWGEFTISHVSPGRDDWDWGETSGGNSALCVVSQAEDKLLPDEHLTDPPPMLGEEMFTMDLLSPQRRENAPVGTCVRDKQSWTDAQGTFVITRCDNPHWAEIVGYPKLADKPDPWPGEKKVRAAAEAACDKAKTELKISSKYKMNITWPERDRWDGTNEIYAVCLAGQNDDEWFVGRLS
jgi:hypothetical protein